MKKFKQYSVQQRVQHLRHWKESGLSQRAYSVQKGINPRTFNNWVKRQKNWKQKEGDRTQDEFIPVKFPDGGKTAGKSTIEIGVGRYRITIEGSFDQRFLHQVLNVLEGRNAH